MLRPQKRLFDLAGAAVLVLVLSPLIALTAIAVRLALGAPVIFRQLRPGLGGRPFTMLKFRTMAEPRDGEDRFLTDGVRLTPFGRFLRRSSLDELPELFNVLRGDMSLVGPRPLLSRYTPYFTERERLRFTVRPGITGLAQVRGRNTASWDRRLAWDVEYVERQSLWLDVTILAATVRRVLAPTDAIPDARTAMLNLDEERGGEGEAAVS